MSTCVHKGVTVGGRPGTCDGGLSMSPYHVRVDCLCVCGRPRDSGLSMSSDGAALTHDEHYPQVQVAGVSTVQGVSNEAQHAAGQQQDGEEIGVPASLEVG